MINQQSTKLMYRTVQLKVAKTKKHYFKKTNHALGLNSFVIFA